MPLLSLVSALAAAVLLPYSTLAPLLLLPAVLASVWRAWPLAGGSNWLVLGWIGWLSVALALSPTPGASLPMTAMLLALPLAWLAGLGLRARGQLDQLLDYGLPLLLSILLLWGLLQGPNTFTQKPQGPLNDPNTYAALLNLLVLPLLARYLAADLALLASWRRTSLLALLGATAFIAFLVASRGASLALLLVSAPLIWAARRQPAFARKLVLLAVVCVAAYLAAYVASGYANVGLRLLDTLTEGDPPRLMLLQSAWLMIQDHPWLGTGFGRFHILYPQYRMATEFGTGGGWVHNDYLQVWVEGGLPMLLLLLGLAGWVIWMGWKTLKTGGKDALLRMGYLAGLTACLLHAVVNFLFFFAIVSLLMGLYLARVSPRFLGAPSVHSDSDGPAAHDAVPRLGRASSPRAVRLVAGGYAFILGWLLLGDVLVEGLLVHAYNVQKALHRLDIAYPRYNVAYWLTVLAPFHPTPQQLMGSDLANSAIFSGGDNTILRAALTRMESAWQLAPCYLPYGNEALFALRQGIQDADLRERGLAMAQRNLDCNARHGLSYYHAGIYSHTPENALEWWRAGMKASPYLGDHLMLATAILSRSTPGREKALADLAEQMAQLVSIRDSNPGIHSDQVIWHDIQYKAHQLAGPRLMELVPPP